MKVDDQIKEARAKGVTGVPFTIIDGRWAVSGGQPAPVFVQVSFRPFFARSALGDKMVSGGALSFSPYPPSVSHLSDPNI